MKKSVYIFFIIIMLFALSGCKQKDKENKQEKIETELKYIGEKIFNLSNELNGISFENYEITSKEIKIKQEDEKTGQEENSSSSEGEEKSSEKTADFIELEKKNSLDNEIEEESINWQEIKKEIEDINSIWVIISIDLKNKKVADNDIVQFSNTLKQTVMSIKNENREESLNNLAQLYSFIPMFAKDIASENFKIIVKSTKSELLKAYSSASIEEWDNVGMYITNAQNLFFEMPRSNEKITFKIDKINQIIQELLDTVELRDFQVFFLHYKMLIENIDTLE